MEGWGMSGVARLLPIFTTTWALVPPKPNDESPQMSPVVSWSFTNSHGERFDHHLAGASQLSELWVGVVEMQVSRQVAVAGGERELDEASNATATLAVAHVGFD